VTGLVTFGDLLETARRSLDQAGGVPGRPESDRDLLDVTCGLDAVVTAVGRYLQDLTSGEGLVMYRSGASRSPWASACVQARQAAADAARQLRLPAGGQRPGWVAASERGQYLQAVALTAGRDLLQTHVTAGPDGARWHRSAWAPAVASPAVSRALTAELGVLARQVAVLGTGLAMSPTGGWADTSPARQAVAGACQSLRVLYGSVRAAHRRDPVLAGDRDLLYAIPVSVMPGRELPDGGERVDVLCRGVIAAAERLRRSARVTAARAAWSPEISAASLRHAAAASTVASHNCSVLLGSLGGQPGLAGSGDAAARFADAGEAAGRARDSWLRAARTLDQMTSDMPGHLAQDADDARDLALWTGRLAYADPQWTLASGPNQPARPVSDLAPGPREAAVVVAAVHHASDALYQLVEVHQAKARSIARGGRFFVPTRSLPESDEVARPYGPAPADRIGLVLAAYQDARTASSDAVVSIADVADVIRAPSRVLTQARAAADSARSGEVAAGATRTEPAEVVGWEPPDMPGPVARTLHSLGVTSADLLRRGAAIDRAGEQLLIDACTQTPTQSQQTAVRNAPVARSAWQSNSPDSRRSSRAEQPARQRQRESREAEP
jgi:hypothetical protein